MFKPLEQVVSGRVERFTSGFNELDWLYGHTEIDGCKTWGIPKSSISMWAGSGGCGKSRLAIELCKHLCLDNNKVLYFQNEETLETFRGKIHDQGSDLIRRNFNLSISDTLEGQVGDILKCEPLLVVVDSINQLREFGSGAKKNIDLIINGCEEYPGYRFLCLNLKCHIILLNQLNADKSVKGGTVLQHLVDAVFGLQRVEDRPGAFIFASDSKNRYGPVGIEFCSAWQHHQYGVLPHEKQSPAFETEFDIEGENRKRIYKHGTGGQKLLAGLQDYWKNMFGG